MWIQLSLYNSHGNHDAATVNIRQITHYRLSHCGNYSTVYLAVPKGDGQCFIQVTETPGEIGKRINDATKSPELVARVA